jgi:hypothetical protein
MTYTACFSGACIVSCHLVSIPVLRDATNLNERPNRRDDNADDKPSEKNRDNQLSRTSTMITSVEIMDAQTAEEKAEDDVDASTLGRTDKLPGCGVICLCLARLPRRLDQIQNGTQRHPLLQTLNPILRVHRNTARPPHRLQLLQCERPSLLIVDHDVVFDGIAHAG